MIAIGIGCRKGCPAEEIVSLVRDALGALQRPRGEERQWRVSNQILERKLGLEEARSQDRLLVRDGLRPPHREATDGRASALFTIAEKRGEVGLEAAARRLGLPLVFLEAEALRRVADGAVTVSPRVEALHDLPSVAETAALAGAGEGAALLVPRISTPRATCAIAGPRP